MCLWSCLRMPRACWREDVTCSRTSTCSDPRSSNFNPAPMTAALLGQGLRAREEAAERGSTIAGQQSARQCTQCLKWLFYTNLTSATDLASPGNALGSSKITWSSNSTSKTRPTSRRSSTQMPSVWSSTTTLSSMERLSGPCGRCTSRRGRCRGRCRRNWVLCWK